MRVRCAILYVFLHLALDVKVPKSFSKSLKITIPSKSLKHRGQKGVLFGPENDPKASKITSWAPDAPRGAPMSLKPPVLTPKLTTFAFLAGLHHGQAPEKDAAPGKQKSDGATIILTPNP